MKYHSWGKETITDFSPENVIDMYNRGFVFTRLGKGIVNKTRSVRVDLMKFSPNSENRRVLAKVEGLSASQIVLPIPMAEYSWEIQKLGKDFYEKKFGPGIFSASKIKALLTDEKLSNFNELLRYSWTEANSPIGYAITYVNSSLMHYAYPFYDLSRGFSNLGMGMMLKAILFAQGLGCKYVYLGSATRTADVYKLQFEGVEWFDGEKWNTETESLKKVLTARE